MKTHRVIIVSGHARGADSLGERFANEFRLPFELHPAKWRLLGKAAGMVRNAEMAKCSDALIAFWDGKSRGTGHMIKFARRNGLDISILDYTLIKAGNITIASPLPSEPVVQPLDDIKQKIQTVSIDGRGITGLSQRSKQMEGNLRYCLSLSHAGFCLSER